MPPPLRIFMSARAVVARGVDFVPRDEIYADLGTALDEIHDLRAPAEPLVLRVEASGGGPSDRAQVVGDWLCDVDGSANRRIPKPTLPQGRGAAWARATTWLDAWEACEDPRWMVRALLELDVARAEAVRALCACVRTTLAVIPARDNRSRFALAVAEQWSRSEATPGQLRAAEQAAFSAAYGVLQDYAEFQARFACCNASLAAYDVALNNLQDAELVMSNALDQAANALRLSRGADPEATFRSYADRVREHVPTLLVLRGASR